MTIEIYSEEEFYRCVNDRRYKATIIKFHAKWCQPCKGISPFYDDLARRHTDIQFLSIDAVAHPVITAVHGVTAIPTFISYKNGVKTNDVITGVKTDEIARFVHRQAHQNPQALPPPPPPNHQYHPHQHPLNQYQQPQPQQYQHHHHHHHNQQQQHHQPQTPATQAYHNNYDHYYNSYPSSANSKSKDLLKKCVIL